MDRQIRRVGVVLMGLFVLLFVQLNWLQVFHRDALANDPRNTRVAVKDFRRCNTSWRRPTASSSAMTTES